MDVVNPFLVLLKSVLPNADFIPVYAYAHTSDST